MWEIWLKLTITTSEWRRSDVFIVNLEEIYTLFIVFTTWISKCQVGNRLHLGPAKHLWSSAPVGNYMFRVNNRSTRTRCEVCSKLTIKTPERCHCRRSGVFIVNLEHISHLVSIVNFEQVNAGWVDVWQGPKYISVHIQHFECTKCIFNSIDLV